MFIIYASVRFKSSIDVIAILASRAEPQFLAWLEDLSAANSSTQVRLPLLLKNTGNRSSDVTPENNLSNARDETHKQADVT